MKVSYRLEDGFTGTLANSRGHEITCDLPEAAGGANKGAKAFELLSMSLAGCIGTIFVDVARKMRLDIQDVRIEMETKDGDTIEEVSYKCVVKSTSPEAKLARCLDLTEKTCPVGLVFHKAGIPISHTLEIIG